MPSWRASEAGGGKAQPGRGCSWEGTLLAAPVTYLGALPGHEPQAVMSHEEEVGDEVEEGQEAMQPQDLTPARSKTPEGETPPPQSPQDPRCFQILGHLGRDGGGEGVSRFN